MRSGAFVVSTNSTSWSASSPSIALSQPPAPASSASPISYPGIVARPTSSKVRPARNASIATWRFGRSHACSARVTIGSSVGSASKWGLG